MGSTESNFFKGKREWSKLKDQVLQNYLPPYLAKVNKLKKRIILVDSFAGPGFFEETGEEGSPVTFCRIAEQIVPNNYSAILVNRSKSHHNTLTSVLKDYISSKKALTINGNASDLLKRLHSLVTDQTLFIYLDPFGLKGTDFETIKKFLNRNKNHSTELLINLSVPTIIRNSCVNSIKQSGYNDDVYKKHSILNKALGGDYWKEVLLDQSLTSKERRNKIIKEYISKLKQFLPYVGYCMVQEKGIDSRLKYIIILASRHKDSQALMNDIMFKSYWKHIWKNYSEGTLFENSEWREILPLEYFQHLEKDIIKLFRGKPNLSRIDGWQILTRYRFMRYTSKDYRQKIKELIDRKIAGFIDTKGTGKINDFSKIYLK